MTQRPSIPAPPYQGGCLCGQVRWSLAARPRAVNACHCDDCKKLSGASHIVMLVAAAEDFTQTGEATSFRKTADSGRQIDIARCTACGTRLWHRNLSLPQSVFVAAGTLDDSSWVVPTSHIWVEKVSPGVTMAEDALKLQGQPANRDALAEAFRTIYSGTDLSGPTQ